MNGWRYLHYKPGAAHLWTPAPGLVWQTCCNRLRVRDLEVTTDPLELGNDRVRKCRVCIPHERRAEDFS